MTKYILILDNIRSVENTASIFRTADCLGVSKIILVGTTPTPLDRFGRKRKDFIKVSLGAEASVPWEYSKTIGLIVQECKSDGFKILALEQHPYSKKLTASTNLPAGKAGKQEPFVLIVGNEVDGVSKEALDLADNILEIPMLGHKESLNVSVATGIALFSLLQ